jgi:hypothetical protein
MQGERKGKRKNFLGSTQAQLLGKAINHAVFSTSLRQVGSSVIARQ